MNFKGKTVLVTGAASGIGYATVKAFAEAGASVILTDVNEAAGGKAAAGLVAAGHQVRFLKLDVTDRNAADAVAAKIKAETGKLDVLVNAAGWDLIQPFMENTPEYWDKIIALNFLGPVQVTRVLLPLLMDSGDARIVNVSSDAGRVGSFGETVYAGANCICPGPTDTPLFAAQSDKMKEALVNAIPMKRLAKPSEIADGILFFASDRSSFCTGQVLSISGGLTMVD
jgi:2-hydroxycyclohexanecarboxyl-CoA dehydrogenase